MRAGVALAAAVIGFVAPTHACAQTTVVDSFDPLSVHALARGSQIGDADAAAAICKFDANSTAPLTLADIVERALCNNPQTHVAWANARAQAAQVGIARSAYLPSVTGIGTATLNNTNGGARAAGAQASNANDSRYTQESIGLTFSYLLYDFGARRANLDSALQTLAALNYTQDSVVQSVFLKAEQAFYALFATQAAVAATKEAERSSMEGLKAATARLNAGSGTPADKLQAQTAYSQAVFNRIQAEGNAKTAQGALANVIGLDANRPVDVATPVFAQPDTGFESDLNALIGQARERRPDLAAAEAQVSAARANIDAAKAAGLPTFSIASGINHSNSNSFDSFTNSTLGVTVNIPFFTGFNRTYQVQSTQARLESQIAARNALSLQVSLDVWQAYQGLTTGTESVREQRGPAGQCNRVRARRAGPLQGGRGHHHRSAQRAVGAGQRALAEHPGALQLVCREGRARPGAGPARSHGAGFAAGAAMTAMTRLPIS